MDKLAIYKIDKIANYCKNKPNSKSFIIVVYCQATIVNNTSGSLLYSVMH